ncbi:MAG: class I SAM-dependent methyltransferase [Actinobacteria bacterium]|nr:class I SAM-dependent methyltransferase [Actinomycetota bacterium]
MTVDSPLDHESTPDGGPVLRQLYPELRAGGFSRADGSLLFYARVNALLSPEMTVLDFGAGRGRDAVDDPVAIRRELRVIKGKVAEVVGVDIDPVVKSNPSLDRALVVEEDAPLPFEDGSVDLIVSDFCFEHLRRPALAARELTRVLRPGGWLCARTPNRWGYIGVGARLVPNRLHTPLLRRLQPARQAHDVFPTAYRLNTRHALREHFPPEAFIDVSYMHNGMPAYFGHSISASRTARVVMRHMPESLSSLLFVFLQRRASANGEADGT